MCLVASIKGIVTNCWIPHVFGSANKGNMVLFYLTFSSRSATYSHFYFYLDRLYSLLNIRFSDMTINTSLECELVSMTRGKESINESP